MKAAIYFACLVALGVLLGLAVVRDPGYVLLAWNTWTLETPLWLFLASLMVLYAVLITSGQVFSKLMSMGAWWGNFVSDSRRRRAQLRTQQGLIALAQGQWVQAEKLLAQGAKAGECPAINYLSAAKAAQSLGALDREQMYLELAKQSPEAKQAAELAQAQLFVEKLQWEEALGLLEILRKKSPRQPLVLKLLMKAYQATHAWTAFIELSQDLVKADVLTPEQAIKENEHAYCERFKAQLPSASSPAALAQAWNQIPKAYHYKSKIAAEYAQALQQRGMNKEAANFIRSTLKKEWSAELIRIYGTITDDPMKRLNDAEPWLKDNASCAALLITLGRLAQAAQIWGKAQRYYEAAIAEQQNVEVYGLLGELFLQLGEMDKSAEAFRAGYKCLNSNSIQNSHFASL